MLILLTNDDGIYAAGISALEKALRKLGDVFVVAPSQERSGAGHSITFQTPLTVRRVFVQENHWGWAVEGSPADCVKIGVTQICPRKPDLVVSGINGGFNAGVNILYSGTVAAAMEGSFYGIDSFAVSMEHCDQEPFDRAGEIAVELIQHVLDRKCERSNLFNINIPIAALQGTPRMKVAPMDTNRYWDNFERRVDPSGKAYYWLIGRPVPRKMEEGEYTDLKALSEGFVCLTPLQYDLTRRSELREMTAWEEDYPGSEPQSSDLPDSGPALRTRWLR